MPCRLLGPKAALAKATRSGFLAPTAEAVLSFVPEWRAACDENRHWKVIIDLAVERSRVGAGSPDLAGMSADSEVCASLCVMRDRKLRGIRRSPIPMPVGCSGMGYGP